jgi:hypothetical protein
MDKLATIRSRVGNGYAPRLRWLRVGHAGWPDALLIDAGCVLGLPSEFAAHVHTPSNAAETVRETGVR